MISNFEKQKSFRLSHLFVRLIFVTFLSFASADKQIKLSPYLSALGLLKNFVLGSQGGFDHQNRVWK